MAISPTTSLGLTQTITYDLSKGAQSLFENKSHFQNCFSSPCPDLNEWEIEARELLAIKAIKESTYFKQIQGLFGKFTFEETQEYLRLNKYDPRDKVLYLSAEHDNTNALNPMLVQQVLGPVDEKFDIKFKLVKSLDEICDEVKTASKVGKLMHVIVDGHGLPVKGVVLSKDGITSWLNKDIVKFPSCFSGLDPSGRLTLSACCTGSPGILKDENCFAPPGRPLDPAYQPYAQFLATNQKRRVIAAVTTVTGKGTQIPSLDPLMFSHVGKSPFPKNLFKVFYPQDPSCPNLDQANLHPREQLAIDVVKSHLVAQSILEESAFFNFTQNYLRICKNDPRKKMLFFDSKEGYMGNENDSHDHPSHYGDMLARLSDKFDLKYKIVSSYDDVCKEIKAAGKAGEIAGVVINAYGSPNDGIIFSKSGNKLDKYVDFSKCFVGMTSSGRILLIGGSAGDPQGGDIHDTLAQQIADQTKRTVIASVKPVSLSKIQLSSIDPLMVSHPNSSLDGTNRFRIFAPFLETHAPLTESQLHPREKAAIATIKTALAAKHLLADSATFRETQEFLRLSKNDLRQKYLYLSADWDPKGWLHPANHIEFLGEKAEKYDLKYKIVDSREAICKEIQEATKIGTLAGVHLYAHGIPFAPYEDESWNWKKNISSEYLDVCFKDRFTCDLLGNCYDNDPIISGQLLAKSNDAKFVSSEFIRACQPEGPIFGRMKPHDWNVLLNEDFSNCISGSQPYDTIAFTKWTGRPKTLAQVEAEKTRQRLLGNTAVVAAIGLQDAVSEMYNKNPNVIQDIWNNLGIYL